MLNMASMVSADDVDFSQKDNGGQFDAQEMTYAPDPILEDGTINIELKGNWKEKGTELFGVLVTISMEDEDSTTQTMHFCRDGNTSECTKPATDDEKNWHIDFSFNCKTWFVQCDKGTF